MTNSSKHQRKHWYPKLVKQQHGEYCKGCGISPTSKGFTNKFTKLYVDKIKNDNNHNIKQNTVTNFQLLCPACNRIKNPSTSYTPYESKSIMTNSEKTNQRAESPWRDWVAKKVDDAQREGEGFPVDEAINAGAELFKISVDTIDRRYLPKLVSSAGRFSVSKNQIYTKHYIKHSHLGK